MYLCERIVDAEVNKPAVPLSCCKKNQYGKYIDEKMCQTWILGPPYKSSGKINIAVYYKVFFSYTVTVFCTFYARQQALLSAY